MYSQTSNPNVITYLNGLSLSSNGDQFTFSASDTTMPSIQSGVTLRYGNCQGGTNCTGFTGTNQGGWWAAPNYDNGYFMAVSRNSTTQSLTISFKDSSNTQHYIKGLTLLWGSVDSYNSITFNYTDKSGSSASTIFNGSDFCHTTNSSASGCLGTTAPSTNSASFEFSAQPDPSNPANCGMATLCYIYPWTSVTFKSTNNAAFEFDDLQFNVATCTTGTACTSAPISAPVPEPATLPLFGIGFVSLAALLRQRLIS
jgi:hypothetical protein